MPRYVQELGSPTHPASRLVCPLGYGTCLNMTPSVTDWITAISTALLVVVGAVAAVGGYWTFASTARSYRDEVAERRHRQANLVSAWFDGEEVMFTNASEAPVYRLIASLVDVRTGTGPTLSLPGSVESRAFCARVLPGDRVSVPLTSSGGGAMGLRVDVELAFTDSAGRHWHRPAFQPLEELETPANTHYGLADPLPWVGALVPPAEPGSTG